MQDSVSAYLTAIGRYERMSDQQMREAGALCVAGAEAQRLIDADHGDQTAAQRRRLERVARQGVAAKHRMIQANLRLVVSIARTYNYNGCQLEDLIQFGNEGLITAVEKFDPRRETRFATMATPWIRQAISRHGANQANIIRLPAHIYHLEQAARRTQAAVLGAGKALTDQQLADAMRCSTDTLALALHHPVANMSLDAPVHDDGSTLDAMVGDPDATAAFDAVAAPANQDLADILISLLDESQRALVRLRFGLSGEAADTDELVPLDKAANMLGIPRTQVRQLERAAVRTMRLAVDPDPDPDQLVQAAPLPKRATLRTMLSALDGQHRQVVALTTGLCGDGHHKLSMDQAATLMGVSTHAASSMRHQALDQMRRHFTPSVAASVA